MDVTLSVPSRLDMVVQELDLVLAQLYAEIQSFLMDLKLVTTVIRQMAMDVQALAKKKLLTLVMEEAQVLADLNAEMESRSLQKLAMMVIT